MNKGIMLAIAKDIENILRNSDEHSCNQGEEIRYDIMSRRVLEYLVMEHDFKVN